MKINSKKLKYLPANKNNWTGRSSNPKLGKQYWHDNIQCIDLEKHKKIKADVSLIGYSCDEGVKRNLGRSGASEAPNSIRERLAKVAYHSSKLIVDAGTVCCVDNYLEECQEGLSNIVSRLIEQGAFPIAIGGGHDIAYANFKGVYNALQNIENRKIGIVNFDAHFDLRPVEKQPNSGTPFNQIITELKNKNEDVDYLAIGIQHQANTRELFDIADKNDNINYINSFDCDFDKVKPLLDKLINNNDYIYITIDMDGFSSAYAPGVSAPSPLGFTPIFVIQSLSYLFSSKKIISCDIAEVNPIYDIDHQTSNLAARLVDIVVDIL